jgi:hypothetical protein
MSNMDNKVNILWAEGVAQVVEFLSSTKLPGLQKKKKNYIQKSVFLFVRDRGKHMQLNLCVTLTKENSFVNSSTYILVNVYKGIYR